MKKRTSSFKVCNFKREKGDIPVYNALTTTPAEMYNSMINGEPIASYLAPNEFFDDGTSASTFEVPLFSRRGVDIEDVWNEEIDAKKKTRDARENAIKSREGISVVE